MKIAAGIFSAAVACAATQAIALEIVLPSDARVTLAAKSETPGFALPVAPFVEGTVQTRTLDGTAEAFAWRFALNGKTTADIMNSIRSQLRDAGYTTLLDCANQRCGGFDFRYQIELLPEPDMHVDLGDFRFLSATALPGTQDPAHIQVVVSRSSTNGFVQITSIGRATASLPVVTGTKTPLASAVADAKDSVPLSSGLLESGFAVLEGLSFGSGSAELADPQNGAIEELARFLQANPDLNVALVGHTDARGGQDANLKLSRLRAQTVVDLLVAAYGISPERLEADGVGYLSPRASNQTAEGRQKNRRVEVVVTSTR
jgi:OOP family OmpA-OmpF porin